MVHLSELDLSYNVLSLEGMVSLVKLISGNKH